MKTIKNVLYLLIALSVLVSCKKEEKSYLQAPTYAREFFDYAMKTSLNYVGDSIIYNDFSGSIDTVKFVYVDSLVQIDTVANQIIYQFNRYISYAGSTLQYLKNYSINKSINGIIRTEDLVNNFILPYQFVQTSKWNGNQYQIGIYQEYTADSVGKIEYGAAQRKQVKVTQLNETNLLEELKIEEKYVERYGMVYQYQKSIRKDISTGEIKSGSIVILALKP